MSDRVMENDNLFGDQKEDEDAPFVISKKENSQVSSNFKEQVSAKIVENLIYADCREEVEMSFNAMPEQLFDLVPRLKLGTFEDVHLETLINIYDALSLPDITVIFGEVISDSFEFNYNWTASTTNPNALQADTSQSEARMMILT